jgi:hypothetical protein
VAFLHDLKILSCKNRRKRRIPDATPSSSEANQRKAPKIRLFCTTNPPYTAIFRWNPLLANQTLKNPNMKQPAKLPFCAHLIVINEAGFSQNFHIRPFRLKSIAKKVTDTNGKRSLTQADGL